jgi:anthranilate synthase component 1
MLKLTDAGRDAFILESVTGGEVRGRYSIIGMKPDLIWECRGADSRDEPHRALRPRRVHALRGARRWRRCAGSLSESAIDMPADLPAAAAGLFGYLGYDMIRLVEHLPDVNPDPLGLPDAVLMRPSVIAVLDGVKGEVTVVALRHGSSSGLSARAAYAQAAERVSDALQRPGTRAFRRRAGDGRCTQPLGEPVSNFAHSDYLAAVEKAKDYIRAGDIFQVVPSQRWRLDFPQPPFALYRALRRTNPSPFMFYFNFGPFQVVGASARDPRPGLRGRGHDPPHRGHSETRGRRRRRIARWRPTCWPTKRNWPST